MNQQTPPEQAETHTDELASARYVIRTIYNNLKDRKSGNEAYYLDMVLKYVQAFVEAYPDKEK